MSPIRRSVALLLALGIAVVVIITANSFGVPERERASSESSGLPPMHQAETPQFARAQQLESAPESLEHSAVRRIPARSAAPRQIVLTYDDGTQMSLSVRPHRLPSIHRPERLADIYIELRELAQRGDGSAAYSLARWLKECSFVPADEAGLDEVVTRVRTKGLMPNGNGGTRPTNDRPRAEGTLNRIFSFCRGISQEQRGEARAWLTMAAATGELFALREQADDLMFRAPERFYAAYQDLWQNHGYSGALSPLAVGYKRGLLGAAPDYMRAYAYQFAEFKLVENVYGQSGFPSHRNMLRAMEDSLANTASYLTPEQTIRAMNDGKRLLAENPNCCVGLLFGTAY